MSSQSGQFHRRMGSDVIPPVVYEVCSLAFWQSVHENFHPNLQSQRFNILVMPGRPTDVVFRNFNELTYIAPEDRVPYIPPTPTYPTRLLVRLTDESPEGSYEYWLHESGKTLRFFLPPRPPPPPPPTPLRERQCQRQLDRKFYRKRGLSFPLPSQNQQQRQTRTPPTPKPTPTPTPQKSKQKQKWQTRWRRKPKQKKPPSAFKAWIIARAEAERKRKRKARQEKREKIIKAITRFLPRVLTVNYIKVYKSHIKDRRSKPAPTPPPISPCKSYCYPPLQPLPPPFSAHLKFWKKRKAVKGEEPIPPPGVMMSAELFESGKVPSPKGAQYERQMWKAACARCIVEKRPLHIALYSRSSELSVVSPGSESNASGSFGTDGDQGSSTGNQSTILTHPSCKSTASSSLSFAFSSPTMSKPCLSRTDSSISSLPSIKDITEPIRPTESTEPKPLLPEPSPPPDPTLHKMANTFYKHRKEKVENPPPEYIACPIFNYQGNPKQCQWAANQFLELYFSIPFTAPWAVVEYLKFTFSWIPFFELLADRIIDNGGRTLILWMSNVTLVGVALPLFCLIILVVWSFCVLHDWFVVQFQRMPFYRFKYSLERPGYLEEGENESDVEDGESESEVERTGAG